MKIGPKFEFWFEFAPVLKCPVQLSGTQQIKKRMCYIKFINATVNLNTLLFGCSNVMYNFQKLQRGVDDRTIGFCFGTSRERRDRDRLIRQCHTLDPLVYIDQVCYEHKLEIKGRIISSLNMFITYVLFPANRKKYLVLLICETDFKRAYIACSIDTWDEFRKIMKKLSTSSAKRSFLNQHECAALLSSPIPPYLFK